MPSNVAWSLGQPAPPSLFSSGPAREGTRPRGPPRSPICGGRGSPQAFLLRYPEAQSPSLPRTGPFPHGRLCSAWARPHVGRRGRPCGLPLSLSPCKRAPAPNGAGSWQRFKAQARPRFHPSTSQATQNWTVFLNPRRSDRLVVSRTFEVPSRWVSGDRGLRQRSGTCSTWGTPNFGQVGRVAWTSCSSCADSDMKDMAS